MSPEFELDVAATGENQLRRLHLPRGLYSIARINWRHRRVKDNNMVRKFILMAAFILSAVQTSTDAVASVTLNVPVSLRGFPPASHNFSLGCHVVDENNRGVGTGRHAWIPMVGGALEMTVPIVVRRDGFDPRAGTPTSYFCEFEVYGIAEGPSSRRATGTFFFLERAAIRQKGRRIEVLGTTTWAAPGNPLHGTLLYPRVGTAIKLTVRGDLLPYMAQWLETVETPPVSECPCGCGAGGADGAACEERHARQLIFDRDQRYPSPTPPPPAPPPPRESQIDKLKKTPAANVPLPGRRRSSTPPSMTTSRITYTGTGELRRYTGR